MPSFNTINYATSGGQSALFESEAGDRLRVETQPESLSVLWSTDRRLGDIFESLIEWLPREVEALLIPASDEIAYAPDGLTVKELVDSSIFRERRWSFVRLDFPDRVVTWESSGPSWGRSLFDFDELGLLADGVDMSYVSGLIEATGTEAVAVSAPRLLVDLSEITRKYPQISLGRTQEAGASEGQ